MFWIYDCLKHLFIVVPILDFIMHIMYQVRVGVFIRYNECRMFTCFWFLLGYTQSMLHLLNNIYAFEFEFWNTFLKTRCHLYQLCYRTNAILVLFNVKLRSRGFVWILKGSKCLNFEFQSMWFLKMHSHLRSYELPIWVCDI